MFHGMPYGPKYSAAEAQAVNNHGHKWYKQKI